MRGYRKNTEPQASANPLNRENYHCHTWRCGHAQGDAADYLAVASAEGARRFGFSDHTPLPIPLYPEIRMELSDLSDYIGTLRRAAADYPEIEVLAGLECEIAPELISFYQELREEYDLDYLVGAPHFFQRPGSTHWYYAGAHIEDPADLRAYAEQTIALMESGLFLFIAHPDLFGASWITWDEEAKACSRDILAAAEEYDQVLEVNGNGMRLSLREDRLNPGSPGRWPYPWEPFWEMAAGYDIRVIVNSDAHQPSDALAGVRRGWQMADQWGLKPADTKAWFPPST